MSDYPKHLTVNPDDVDRALARVEVLVDDNHRSAVKKALTRLPHLGQFGALDEDDDSRATSAVTAAATSAAAAFIDALYGGLPDDILDVDRPETVETRIRLAWSLREDVISALVKGFTAYAAKETESA
ncbi:hypothetical protein BST28_17440 [Mycolicibacter kumamotonensis]|uniref:Uncharacterized protein n=1 Tax=Mycolicibacter kumamotonensis TaxID=354243 RepID=A0A1X0DYQ9_9MYCO|nr:hypothetical protein [Mycolicibacter kumamotonensis]ORA77586.1 hypothetical protein BST28_17440 [Mycolicibacter kumamotonensis]